MKIIKLELAGFKSFGNRKSITFNEGITAMVGPNGSGKSNIADAIRWVLGEQKLRRIRVQKSEEVIFLGTNKKSRASLAEVTLLLENSNKSFGIDASEIEISRKIYRSGEFEYRLNNRKVKLSDIIELLAKAGFGTETYTVIGQGMVDQLLSSSAQERKLLFDEASGIRQYEIRRNNAQKKLSKAENNLDQINNILKELTPTIKLLDAYSLNQSKKQDLEKQLNLEKIKYLSNSDAYITQSLEKNQKDKKNTSKQLQELSHAIQEFHHTNQLIDNSTQTTEKLKSLEFEKDSLTQQLLSKQNELDIFTEKEKIENQKLSNLDKQIEHINISKVKYQKEFIKQNLKVDQLQQKIDDCNARLEKVNSELGMVQQKLIKNQKKEFVSHALGLIQNVRIQLRQDQSRSTVDKSLHRVLQMLELAMQDDSMKLFEQTTKLQREINYLMTAREEYIELQTKHTIKLRAIEIDISSFDSELQTINTEKQNLQVINKKLLINAPGSKNLQNEIKILNNKIAEVSKKINDLRENIYNASQQNNQNNQIIVQAEENAAKKRELEIKLNELDEMTTQLLLQQKQLENTAKSWKISNIPKLKSKIKRIPDINNINTLIAEIEAISEFDPAELKQARESQNRLEFLNSQKSDLEKAIDSSKKLIESLQLDIKNKFEKSFVKLNTAFAEYFKKLFEGGQAQLILIQQDNEYGIDIIANPPNKKTKSLNSLSGGERALTSIALLSAIITTNPSPFIVLDEVDAALDDENSTKFCEILQGLSKKSQILVITHNQETMQAATNLVGITTAKDGDSEVLQLNLEKAVEFATTK